MSDRRLAFACGRTRRAGRRLAATSLAVSLALLAACGDDAKESFCDTRDSLQSNISALSDLDVVSEGTSGLQERLDAIRDDISELRDDGAAVADEEINALDSAVSDLGKALGDLSGGVTVDEGQALVDATTRVATAASDVVSTLADACD